MAKFLYKHRRGTLQDWSNYEKSKYIQTKQYYANTTYYSDVNGTIANPQPTKTEVENGFYYIENPNYLIPAEGEIVIEIDKEHLLHKLKIGDGKSSYADLKYLMAGDEIVTQVLSKSLPRIITITLNVDDWESVQYESNPDLTCYKQTLEIDGITSQTKLNLQPDANMLAEFQKLNLVFVAENEIDGTTKTNEITIYSIGDKPSDSYTMQATIVEADVQGEQNKVVGIPVGTPTPQSAFSVDYDVNLERLQYYGDASIVPTDTANFKFTISDNTACIDGFADGVELAEIVIPYKYTDESGDEYSVTMIGAEAFQNISTLTSVVIPETITEIEHHAFYYCGLTSIVIPDSVKHVWQYAFQGNPIKTVKLSNSITQIWEGIFAQCPIEEIVIPEGVKVIDDAAFVFAKDTHIVIPRNVTVLGEYVFEGCQSLLEVEILNDNISIADNTFVDCSNLTIICGQGSTAETFCKAHDIPYRYNTVGSSALGIEFAEASIIDDILFLDTYLGVSTGGTSDNDFIITCTMSNTMVTDASATYDEILEAYNAGREIKICAYNATNAPTDLWLCLVSVVEGTEFIFSGSTYVDSYLTGEYVIRVNWLNNWYIAINTFVNQRTFDAEMHAIEELVAPIEGLQERTDNLERIVEGTVSNVSRLTNEVLSNQNDISNLETQIGDINTALETALNGGV